MAATEHRTLEAGREVASLTCPLSPSEQGKSLKDEKSYENALRAFLQTAALLPWQQCGCLYQ